MEINLTTVLVAAVSSGGVGLVLREVIGGFAKIGRGVSFREGKRKDDLVAERDRANARADMAEAREEAYRDDRDIEERNRRRFERYAAQLEHILIVNGHSNDLPSLPEVEDTISPAQLRQIKGGTP